VAWLVVGLGNPGAGYEGSRHNLGAAAVLRTAARHGVTLRGEKGVPAAAVALRLGEMAPSQEGAVVLAVPSTFMNDSGVAVGALLRRYHIEDLDQLVIVHDELDLPVGAVRVKLGGGIAGHNGLRSIETHAHGLGFCRVRIGIGRPPGRMHGADYVLRRPPPLERELLDVALEQAADAIERIVRDGADAAMNVVNQR
jgi:PTH1 family peptidyl-tRNA hydrolase